MFLMCVFTCVYLLCYDNVCSKLTKRGRRKLPSRIMTCQSKSGTTFLTFLSFRSILSIWFSTYRAPIYYKGIFIYLSVCAYLRNYFIAIIRYVKNNFSDVLMMFETKTTYFLHPFGPRVMKFPLLVFELLV